VPTKPGSWATIDRTWNAGDRVTIQIPMRLHLVPIDRQHPQRVALMYGPVVLVQDGRYTQRLTSVPGGGDLGITHVGNGLQFRVAAHPKSIFRPEWGAFMPFYEIGQGFPYWMYFDLV
jgi:DUF1680 family protein